MFLTGFIHFFFLDIKALSQCFPRCFDKQIFSFLLLSFGLFEVVFPVYILFCVVMVIMDNSTLNVVVDSISKHPSVLNIDMNEWEIWGYVNYNSNTNVAQSSASVESLLNIASENGGFNFFDKLGEKAGPPRWRCLLFSFFFFLIKANHVISEAPIQPGLPRLQNIWTNHFFYWKFR